MNRLAHHFTSMAYNSAWANHRLLSAVGRLSQEEFAAKRTSFFPSLRATLNHNVAVDRYYVDALERSLRGENVDPDARRVFEPDQEFAACHELHEAQKNVDRRLVALCVGLADDRLDTDIAILRETGVQCETATRLLAHLFQHQIHHRGQAHAMLAGTSVEPPQLDEFFCAGDAELRASDLAELGYSEAMIFAPNAP